MESRDRICPGWRAYRKKRKVISDKDDNSKKLGLPWSNSRGGRTGRARSACRRRLATVCSCGSSGRRSRRRLPLLLLGEDKLLQTLLHLHRGGGGRRAVLFLLQTADRVVRIAGNVRVGVGVVWVGVVLTRTTRTTSTVEVNAVGDVVGKGLQLTGLLLLGALPLHPFSSLALPSRDGRVLGRLQLGRLRFELLLVLKVLLKGLMKKKKNMGQG